jgi:hypothetical protein
MNKKLTNAEYKKLEDLVYNYKTKYKAGFLASEQKELLEKFPEINMDRYYDVLTGITCQMEAEGMVIYHCDILQALVCGLENREQYAEEWD